MAFEGQVGDPLDLPGGRAELPLQEDRRAVRRDHENERVAAAQRRGVAELQGLRLDAGDSHESQADLIVLFGDLGVDGCAVGEGEAGSDQEAGDQPAARGVEIHHRGQDQSGQLLKGEGPGPGARRLGG